MKVWNGDESNVGRRRAVQCRAVRSMEVWKYGSIKCISRRSVCVVATATATAMGFACLHFVRIGFRAKRSLKRE